MPEVKLYYYCNIEQVIDCRSRVCVYFAYENRSCAIYGIRIILRANFLFNWSIMVCTLTKPIILFSTNLFCDRPNDKTSLNITSENDTSLVKILTPLLALVLLYVRFDQMLAVFIMLLTYHLMLDRLLCRRAVGLDPLSPDRAGQAEPVDPGDVCRR